MTILLTLSEQTHGGVHGSIELRDNMHPGHDAPELVLSMSVDTQVSGDRMSCQTAKLTSCFALSENQVQGLTAICSEWLRNIDEHRRRMADHDDRDDDNVRAGRIPGDDNDDGDGDDEDEDVDGARGHRG